MQTIKFNIGGDGLWSTVKGSVEIVNMQMGYINDEKDFGELCVYFNTADWNVKVDGLIYTDKQFMRELNAFLVAQGLAEVSYSEQGMQGDDYVSCDVEDDFITAWEAKFGEIVL